MKEIYLFEMNCLHFLFILQNFCAWLTVRVTKTVHVIKSCRQGKCVHTLVSLYNKRNLDDMMFILRACQRIFELYRVLHVMLPASIGPNVLTMRIFMMNYIRKLILHAYLYF